MLQFEGEIKELDIPVPWGHIAVKAWGDESNTHVLVFHGRLDNAGAFDNLIPLLPKNFYFICCDFPSHGKSSHFPHGTPLYSVNFLLAYTYIMNYFNHDSYIVIGHSYGGHLGFLYARLYPERISKLVMIDTIYYDVVPVEYFNDYIKSRFEIYVKLMEKLSSGKQPVYSYEEAKEKLMHSRATDPLSESAARALLKRNLKQVGDNQYVFTTDQRMKSYFDMLHDFRYAIEELEYNPISCPVLMVLGNKNKQFHNLYSPVFETFKKLNQISIKYVDGGHDIHNNNPENVAPHVARFLLEEGPKKSNIGSKAMKFRWYSRVLKWAKL